MLQSGCSYTVLKSILEVLAIQHTADHAACEGVAAAYTVNDGMDAVLFGVIELLGISGVDASRPTVIGSGMAYTQRGYAVLEVELVNHLLEDRLVTSQLQLTAGNIGIAGLEAKYQLSIFFVTDTYINVLHQVSHNLLSLLGAPQLLTEVQVYGYLYAVLLSSDQSLLGQLCCSVGYSGGNTGEVEPVSAFEDLIEVEISLGCGRDRGMCSIVYNLGRSHGRTALQVVDTQSLTASCDVLGLYVVLSQSCYCALTDLVVRNCSNELSVMTVVSQRYCYVSFTAAVVYIELVCLDKFLVVGGGQSQHDLTHGNYFCHFGIFLSQIKIVYYPRLFRLHIPSRTRSRFGPPVAVHKMLKYSI